ncbi:MAG TPA: dienelactone hydrolase family protein [Anaerolineales bacterium]|nr:dienelactone hydrolase family protein [Anaerolineales bacterium]
MSIQKSEIQLQVNDKTAKAYLAAPESGGPGVLVLHAWWGLKPFFKQVCDKLAEQGFTALAPDLYQDRIAQTIDEAKALLGQRDLELMGDTVKAAKDHLVSLNPGKPIGVLGFSMGAEWSLIVAANEPDVSAAVLFYGPGEVDFTKVKARVLGHFAEMDEWEDLDFIKAMEKDMKAAGMDVTLHFYPEVGHWFVEEDRPEYNPDAATLAWERTFGFLRASLPGAA